MDWSGVAKRALAVGAVGGIATQLIYGNQGAANVWGMEVSSPTAVGVSAGLGSVSADAIHYWMPAANIGGLGVSAMELGAAGLVTGAAMSHFGVDNGISVEGVAMGAGSLLGGRWALNTLGQGEYLF